MRKLRVFSIIVSFLLFFPLLVSAIAVTISVQDPGGAAVPGAEVLVAGKSYISDAATGGVSLPDLPEGAYTVTVRKSGFETTEQRIEVKGAGPAAFTIVLKLAAQQTSVDVDSRRSSLANSDPNYKALRNASLVGNYAVQNLELKRDLGTFTFRSGQFSFLSPVMGRTVMAVFTGDGVFHLKPLLPWM